MSKSPNRESIERDIKNINSNMHKAFNATELQTMRAQVRRVEFQLKQLGGDEE